MKKLFLLICLFLPFLSYTEDAILDQKVFIIEEAENHKQKAIEELTWASDMRYLIPDLGDRQHMDVLIASLMTTPMVQDPKLKILTVGLALLGSLATNSYHKYQEYREHLANAAYHFEMYNFYQSLSMKFTKLANTDEGTQFFMKAIDCLTLCDTFAYLIDDKLFIEFAPFDLKIEICNCVLEYRNELLKNFKKYGKKIAQQMPEKMSISGMYLYENLGEIFEGCDEFEDHDLSWIITEYVYKAVLNLRKAEKAWGVK